MYLRKRDTEIFLKVSIYKKCVESPGEGTPITAIGDMTLILGTTFDRD